MRNGSFSIFFVDKLFSVQRAPLVSTVASQKSQSHPPQHTQLDHRTAQSHPKRSSHIGRRGEMYRFVILDAPSKICTMVNPYGLFCEIVAVVSAEPMSYPTHNAFRPDAIKKLSHHAKGGTGLPPSLRT